MEQKKILWVVAAVSVFVLVIFGFALVIYSPSKTAEEERGAASVIINGKPAETALTSGAGSSPQSVDPDSWARNPEAMPGFDTEIVPSRASESLTDINSAYVASPAQEPEAEIEETINVRDLSSRTSNEERPAGRQPESAAGRGRSTGVIAVRQPQSTASRPAKPQAAESESGGTGRQERQAAERQTVTVVEYWIQTGSFSSKLNAENARKMLTDRFFNAEIFTKDNNGTIAYRVRVGPYKDKTEAEYWLGTISETPEFSESMVFVSTAQR